MTDAYPLRWPEGWPRARSRKPGTFSRTLTVDGAFRDLRRELGRLRASHVVISSNIRPRNVSSDPTADARHEPGVAIYFQISGRPMSMAQDAFDSVAKNARSLALAIEAMRAIERHGGGHMMQRSFDGFAQLPPPEGTQSAPKRPWRTVLELDGMAGPNFAQLAGAEASYRTLARKHHPDAGGSADAMAELNIAINEAREELR